MNFDFTDEQQEIKATAHEFLAARFNAREGARAGRGAAATTTRSGSEICELGWPGIAVAEEHGGQGLGMVELAVLLEELGLRVRAAPVPLQRRRRRC